MIKIIIAGSVAVLGIVAIVLAGMDDSPGGQLIALAIVVAAVVVGVRALRARTRLHSVPSPKFGGSLED